MSFLKGLIETSPFIITPQTNERYHEGERADFNKFVKPIKNPRHQRVRTREQPGNLAIGRVLFRQAQSQSAVSSTTSQLNCPPPPPPS